MKSLLLITCLAAGYTATAQNRTPGDTLRSPLSSGPGKALIRLYAPKASEVKLVGDFTRTPIALTSDGQGIWKTEIGPLRPDYYTYTLIVDGVRTLDPKNASIKQGIASVENVVLIPGSETAFEDVQNVPHGELRQVWYSSSTLGRMRRMHVYTPPGYEKGRDSYPVFYLLHGAGDDDSGWSTIGRAGFIFDNLIAAGKIKPMVVVMPNGSMPTEPGTPLNMNRMRDLFSSELLKDILPRVEAGYRVKTSPADRAIAGLSMGGFQTLDVVLSRPELFTYAGVFSSGFFGPSIDEAETKYSKSLNDKDFNSKKKLFWIGIGKDDFVMEANRKTLALLDKHQIRYQYKETEGGHTWINWRQYLNEFTPMLFR